MKKLSSRPDMPPPTKQRTIGAVPVPPARNNGRDDYFPFDIMRKSICQTNALSFALGDCAKCKTPDACEDMTSAVKLFINGLHQ